MPSPTPKGRGGHGCLCFHPRGAQSASPFSEIPQSGRVVRRVYGQRRIRHVTKPSYQIDEGYFVKLKTLTKHLTEMSHDVHQWGAIAVPGTYRRGSGNPESYALIGYSNPEPP